MILTPDLYQSMMEKIQVYDEKEALLAIANYKKEKARELINSYKIINGKFSNNLRV